MMVADSDLLIDFLRGKEPGCGRIKDAISAGPLATTVVNVFELKSGARTDRERDKVSALLAALTILPLDESAATAAARTREALEARGAAIGMADYLIAGVCLAIGATLLTRNLDHFDRATLINQQKPDT